MVIGIITSFLLCSVLFEQRRILNDLKKVVGVLTKVTVTIVRIIFVVERHFQVGILGNVDDVVITFNDIVVVLMINH